MTGQGQESIDVNLWRARIKAFTFGHYHLEMGYAIEKEGELETALGCYQRALTFDPSLCEIPLLEAGILHKLGRGQDAERTLAQLATPAEKARGHFRIGAHHLAAAQLFEAGVEHLKQAAAAGYVPAVVLLSVDGENTADFLPLAEKIDIIDESERDLLLQSLLILIEGYEKQKRWNYHDLAYSYVALLDPHNYPKAYDSAYGGWRRRFDMAALDVLMTHGVRQGVKSPVFDKNHAMMLFETCDFAGALAVYDQCLAKYPDSHLVCHWRLMRGCSSLPLGNIESAITDFDILLADKATLAFPSIYQQAFFYRGIAWQALGNQAEAEASYRAVFNLAPTTGLWRSGLGLALHTAGAWAGADRHHRAAIATEPTDGWCLLHRAFVLEQQGCRQDALRLVRWAKRSDPIAVRYYAAHAVPWQNTVLNALLQEVDADDVQPRRPG